MVVLSPNHVGTGAVAQWEEQLDKQKTSQLSHVRMTVDGKRAAVDRSALLKAHGDIQETLIAWGPPCS